ncbi:MAG: UxaA family hydrolase [Candidatus Parvarchaeota archaeon]|uniref:UxaA family hydrolase n=1 Tax=Metallosphaera sp. TaxID=2020860 RepID=UPI003179D2ED
MGSWTFLGFERENGFGTRNHILLIPTVACSEITVRKILKGVGEEYRSPDGYVKVLHNPFGCGQTGKDLDQTTRTLINMGKNPNVNSVLVMALGCESVDYDHVADEISKIKPVSFLRIQDMGGKATVERGVEKVRDMIHSALQSRRKETDASNLSIGLKCGASDFSSGLASNPLVGKVSDWIVGIGGTSIIGEVPEFIGAEHLYAERAMTPEIREEILKTVKNFEKKLKEEANADFRKAQPAPGNISGGITTIEEKSLGAVKKSGSSKVSGVLDYAEIPGRKGHFLMNTPGYDVESVSGEVAGGCNLVLFTTGRGTPTGNVIAPVIKITANRETFSRMNDFIDFDASGILEGEETIQDSFIKLRKMILDVASGKLVRAEENDQDDFAIYRVGPTY